jgi:fructose-specific phosphotransferase system IIA component
MKISELLNERLIKIGLVGAEKEEVFEELIDLLLRERLIGDRRAAYSAILEREKKQSTGIGYGVAIPHGKSGTVKQLCAALGISKSGVEYESLDGEPVQVVFMLLAEENKPGPHVMALAQIATLFKVSGFIDRLIAAKTAKELYDVVVAEEEKEA